MSKVLDEDGVILLSADIKTLSDATYPANAAMASAYSSSSAYSIGDYCLYGGLLYKCNTTIASGGETWTTAHWIQVNVANELQSKASKLVFLNTTILPAAFENDETYEDYPYKASLVLSGVTSTMIPEVVFGLTEILEGIFAPISETFNGGIYLYSNDIPDATIIIPTIICWII